MFWFTRLFISSLFGVVIAKIRVIRRTNNNSTHILAAAGHVADAPNRTSAKCATLGNSLRVRVLVVPSEFRGQEHRERLLAIQETWGKPGEYSLADGRCLIWEVTFANEGSAYKGSGNEGFELLNALPSELMPPLEVQKKGRAVSLVHNMLHEFERSPRPDWIFKVDDCAFVLPENAAALFSSYDSAKPLLLGGQLRTQPAPLGQTFASAAGFALSSGALQRIGGLVGKEGLERLERSVGKAPDVGLARLCNELDVKMPDTRDNKLGGERFNVFPPLTSIRGQYHDWFRKFKQNAGHGVQNGLACCAKDSVLFHYIGAADMRFLQGALRGTESDSQRLLRWPSTGASLIDTWKPILRPSPDGVDPIWSLLDRIREHLGRAAEY